MSAGRRRAMTRPGHTALAALYLALSALTCGDLIADPDQPSTTPQIAQEARP